MKRERAQEIVKDLVDRLETYKDLEPKDYRTIAGCLLSAIHSAAIAGAEGQEAKAAAVEWSLGSIQSIIQCVQEDIDLHKIEGITITTKHNHGEGCEHGRTEESN